MKIQRQIAIHSWDEATASLAVNYLKSRAFTNAQAVPTNGGMVVSATRGSWLGNLASFDMTKLRAKIRVAGETSGTVTIDLDVNTFAQQITQWNLAVWRLELIELQRVLTGLGCIEEVWNRFNFDYRAAATGWALTATIAGQQLPQAWVTELAELEDIPAFYP